MHISTHLGIQCSPIEIIRQNDAGTISNFIPHAQPYWGADGAASRQQNRVAEIYRSYNLGQPRRWNKSTNPISSVIVFHILACSLFQLKSQSYCNLHFLVRQNRQELLLPFPSTKNARSRSVFPVGSKLYVSVQNDLIEVFSLRIKKTAINFYTTFSLGRKFSWPPAAAPTAG